MTLSRQVFCSTLSVATAASPAVAPRDLKNMPSPDPEEEPNTFRLPTAFEVQLFADDQTTAASSKTKTTP